MASSAPPATSIARPALTRRQVTMTMAGVMLAMFVSALNQTVIATAMPRIITDLGGFNLYAWVSTAFLITSTVVVPITGKLTDMYGRKLFYIIGIAIFTVGSLLCGLSQNMTQIILFRAFQGIGAGVMMTNAFTVIGDIFPPQDRGKYIGLLSAMFGLSSVVGPTLGGIITDTLSWPWVFFINVPLGLFAIVMFLRFFPDIRTGNARHAIDYWGVVTLTLAAVPAMLALSWGGTVYAWGSPIMIGTFVFSGVMLALFLVIERRAPEPVIPFSLFRDRTIAISLIITFIVGIGTFGVITFVPLFFQGVMGTSATASGSFLTPMMLGMVTGSALSGQLLSRTGGRYKIQGGVGILLSITGLVMLSRLNTQTSFAQAITWVAFTGFGNGLLMPCYMIAVQNSVPKHMLGVATSTSLFFRSIGSTLGLSVFGSVMINRFASQFLTNVPESVKAVIPAEQVTGLVRNPQALVNPDAQARLRSLFDSLGDQGPALFETVLRLLREALASALGLVFLIGLGTMIVAFVVNLFLSNKSESEIQGPNS